MRYLSIEHIRFLLFAGIFFVGIFVAFAHLIKLKHTETARIYAERMSINLRDIELAKKDYENMVSIQTKGGSQSKIDTASVAPISEA